MLTCVDFETFGIEGRPNYPPKPVGVAIAQKDRRAHYYAFGHKTGNNCTWETAKQVLKDLWASSSDLLFHNAKFDLDVAREHFGLGLPDWRSVHDTLYQIFLRDPHAPSLGLKQSAERILGMPPDELDAVHEWLLEHKIVRKGQRDYKKFICEAPGDLVGKYAIADVKMTMALHEKLFRELDAGERAAYDRERQLMPILLRNEQGGMHVDVVGLASAVKNFDAALGVADAYLRKRLKAADLNLDSDAEVADVLKARGVVTEWEKTKTGKDSTSKKTLTVDKFSDQKVAQVLGYRNRLTTVLSMSMRPWLEQARACGGRISTEWNQVRSSHGSGFSGTRTGRLSCSRFQNITKDFMDKGDGYTHPKFLRVPELPKVRDYILPDPGQVFCHRDHNQQELRILAHFEDGPLCAAYNENPRMDIHEYVRGMLSKLLGVEVGRRPAKILNFGKVYGMGAPGIMRSMNCDRATAERFIQAHRQALPGVAALDREIKQAVRDGGFIRTWGGRKYRVEEPKIIGGVMRTFEYKMLNYLIQGSAADCTKQNIINYEQIRKNGRVLSTVHDEINISVPERCVASEMRLLREAMSDVKFDVPMLSDGKVGSSWGLLQKYNDD